MNMKILIGYDGSHFAKDAIEDLQRAGLGADVEATVMTVADVWPIQGAGKASVLPSQAGSLPMLKMRDQLVEGAMAEAKSLAEEGANHLRLLFGGWKVETAVSSDTPHVALIEAAMKLKADLLVIGPRGRSGLAQAVERIIRGVGSVASQVLRLAPCSVRVGRVDRADASAAGRAVRIVIGLDGSAESATALQAVGMRRWSPGTEFKLITVLEMQLLAALPALSGAWSYLPSEDAMTWAKRAVDRCADELRASGLAASAAVLQGDPKYVLPEEAKKFGADCIFLGAHGLSRLERLMLGSVSSTVAERAPCSVEVVRSGA